MLVIFLSNDTIYTELRKQYHKGEKPMNLGNQIRELRKIKGMTQEQLAEKLNLSPQAVSKWELGGGCPDINLIPVLANLFNVSIDTLFGFDIAKREERVEEIRREANNYFWEDFEKCEKILKAGIEEFPASDNLKADLIDLYECHTRDGKRSEYVGKGIALAGQIIGEATDIFALCRAKSNLANFYLRDGRYVDAKEVINSLPTMYPYMLADKMRCCAYMLKGEDRLSAAKEWKIIENQELFIACALEGEGYYEIGDYENALRSFTEAVDVIERFMLCNGKICFDAYPITGTQSNHWSYLLRIAACHLKLGHTDECNKAIDRAYFIITHAWDIDDEWEKKSEKYMRVFREEYRKLGLDEYRLPDK